MTPSKKPGDDSISPSTDAAVIPKPTPAFGIDSNLITAITTSPAFSGNAFTAGFQTRFMTANLAKIASTSTESTTSSLKSSPRTARSDSNPKRLRRTLRRCLIIPTTVAMQPQNTMAQLQSSQGLEA